MEVVNNYESRVNKYSDLNIGDTFVLVNQREKGVWLKVVNSISTLKIENHGSIDENNEKYNIYNLSNNHLSYIGLDTEVEVVNASLIVD